MTTATDPRALAEKLAQLALIAPDVGTVHQGRFRLLDGEWRPGRADVQQGRTRIIAINAAARLAHLAQQIKRTPAQAYSARRRQLSAPESRSFPKYKPGMSAAEYVTAYWAANGHGKPRDFFGPLNTAPADLYEGGATDYEVTADEAPEPAPGLPAPAPAPTPHRVAEMAGADPVGALMGLGGQQDAERQQLLAAGFKPSRARGNIGQWSLSLPQHDRRLEVFKMGGEWVASANTLTRRGLGWDTVRGPDLAQVLRDMLAPFEAAPPPAAPAPAAQTGAPELDDTRAAAADLAQRMASSLQLDACTDTAHAAAQLQEVAAGLVIASGGAPDAHTARVWRMAGLMLARQAQAPDLADTRAAAATARQLADAADLAAGADPARAVPLLRAEAARLQAAADGVALPTVARRWRLAAASLAALADVRAANLAPPAPTPHRVGEMAAAPSAPTPRAVAEMAAAAPPPPATARAAAPSRCAFSSPAAARASLATLHQMRQTLHDGAIVCAGALLVPLRELADGIAARLCTAPPAWLQQPRAHPPPGRRDGRHATLPPSPPTG